MEDEDGVERKGRNDDKDHMEKICDARDNNDNLSHLTFLFDACETAPLSCHCLLTLLPHSLLSLPLWL